MWIFEQKKSPTILIIGDSKLFINQFYFKAGQI